MKSFKEYLEHAEYLIENHFVEGMSPSELAKKIQEKEQEENGRHYSFEEK